MAELGSGDELLMHLGMSGSFRAAKDVTYGTHDHEPLRAFWERLSREAEAGKVLKAAPNNAEARRVLSGPHNN